MTKSNWEPYALVIYKDYDGYIKRGFAITPSKAVELYHDFFPRLYLYSTFTEAGASAFPGKTILYMFKIKMR